MTYLDVSHYEGIKVPIEMTSLTLVQNFCGMLYKVFRGTYATKIVTDILMSRPPPPLFGSHGAAAENVRTPKKELGTENNRR